VASARSKEQPVYVEVEVTLGDQEPLRQLHPVKVSQGVMWPGSRQAASMVYLVCEEAHEQLP
jgi:hypothetical protein